MGIMTKVLVPVSLEEEGELVVKFLAGMKSVGTKSIVLANVISSNGVESPEVASEIDIAREKFSELIAPTTEYGIDVEIRASTGEIGEEIAQLATTENFTGLVIGTHGHSAWAKLFSGSIAADLLTRVRLPMMFIRFDLLRNAKDPAQLAFSFPQTLIVPVDFSAGSLYAILALLEMGLPKVGRVFLVHVLAPHLKGEELEKAEAGAVYQLKNEAAMLQGAGVDAHIVVRQGEPTRELLDEIDDRRATGVLLGARGRSKLQAAVLGSKSGTIVERAPCPVIIVP